MIRKMTIRRINIKWKKFPSTFHFLKCKVSTRREESRNSWKKYYFVIKREKKFGEISGSTWNLERGGEGGGGARTIFAPATGYVNYTCKYSEATEPRKIERRDIEIRVGDPHTFASSFRRFYAIERSWLKVAGYLLTLNKYNDINLSIY